VSNQQINEYYDLINNQNIEDILRELIPHRITGKAGGEILVDCPNHQSNSHTSLNINPKKQNWICRGGCGVGGKLIHLVQFIQSGEVTKRSANRGSISHQNARNWLAARIGLPNLINYGKTSEEMQQIEEQYNYEEHITECLTAIAKYYRKQLLDNPTVLSWVRDQWGLSDETMENFLFGFADTDKPGIRDYLNSLGFSDDDIKSTGCFTGNFKTKEDNAKYFMYPFFKDRITMCYFRQGKVSYIIGRFTPWTYRSIPRKSSEDIKNYEEKKNLERGKYKKSLVYSEKHDYVAKFIQNDMLLNEDILLTKPLNIFCVEGYTDLCVLDEHGFPAISPVTISIADKDINRIIQKLKNIKDVTLNICFDVEVSHAGYNGAVRIASRLKKAGIKSKIVTLSLFEKQINARSILENKYGANISAIFDEMRDDTKAIKAHISRIKEGRTPEELQEIEQLISDAKMDVCLWFQSGGTSEQFQELVNQAKSLIDFQIDKYFRESNQESRENILISIFDEIAELEPVEQDKYIDNLHEMSKKSGKKIPKDTFKKQIVSSKARNKDKKEHEKNINKLKQIKTPSAPLGSCLQVVEQALYEGECIIAERKESKLFSSYIHAGSKAFEWFQNNGAKFLKTFDGTPIFYFNNQIYYPTGNFKERTIYEAMIQKYCHISPITHNGKEFFKYFITKIINHGEIINKLSWLHTNIDEGSIFYNLNNLRYEIIKISNDKIEILNNGGNPEGIILNCTSDIMPINYIEDADIFEADRLFKTLISTNLTCIPEERLLIELWLSCFLFLDFTKTTPATRFEGTIESGKSTASDFISYLIFGKLQSKISTTASNYAEGMTLPLQIFDNLEEERMSSDFYTFLITSVTGIINKKRDVSSNSGVVSEQVKCLINSNGVDPIGAGKTEILSRLFIFKFSKEYRIDKCFNEVEAMNQILKNRDYILSGLFKRTSIVLSWIKTGHLEVSRKALEDNLGKHQKSRFNGYLAFMLMYHQTLAKNQEEFYERTSQFIEAVKYSNSVSEEVMRDSHPIADALKILFQSWYIACLNDEQNNRYSVNNPNTEKAKFLSTYKVEIIENEIRNIKAAELFTPLKIISNQQHLEFPYKKPRQFAQRFSGELNIIQNSGFFIDCITDKHRYKYYTIKPVENKFIVDNMNIDSCNTLNTSNDLNKILNFVDFNKIKDLQGIMPGLPI